MNRLSQRQRKPAEPRIVAFAGGAGGVGRSTVTAEVARCLVRRGRKVLIVDTDPVNPTHHVRFGVPADELADLETTFSDEGSIAALIVPGDRKRPAILPLALVRQRPFTRPELRPESLVARLRALDFDVVLLDLPPCPDPVWTGLFVEADVPVLVAATEATSLLATTRTLRHALVHALLRNPAAADRKPALTDAVDKLPLEFEAATLRETLAARGLEDLLDHTREAFETYLVLLRTREVAERELAPVIAFALSRRLGHRPRPLGCLDQDERRWFHLRQDETSPAMTADGGFGNQAEELAKRIVDLDAVDAAWPHHPHETQPWQVLGVASDTPDADVRLAYRRLWEGVRRDSSTTRTLMSAAERARFLQELEEAHRGVQVWLGERGAAHEAAPETEGRPRTGHAGERVRDARQASGLGLRELSLRTRIGLRYLEAIEAFEVEALPRPVYLRGYLREIARCTGVDADALLDDYLTAVSDARSDRILTR